MHYIRFLKVPKVQVEPGSVVIKATVTVTTDLGETFYPHALDLVATLRSLDPEGDIFLRRKLSWTPGARALNLSLDVSRQDIEWPAAIHVCARISDENFAFSPSVPSFLPAVVDVWSGLLNPVKGDFDAGRRIERRFTSLSERPLVLYEEAGDSIARHLWDGSQALAYHIDQVISLEHPVTVPLLEYVLISATYRRLNVLELGCGCGTVGLSLAQAIPACNVILTDLPDVADLVNANIVCSNPAMASRARFEPLDWLNPTSSVFLQHRTNDLIIVSECTYNADTLQPLVDTLLTLLVRSPKAVIVVCTKTRHASEAQFFDMMLNAGLIEEGSMRLPLPGIPGDGYADSATDVGLHLFRGKEHRLSLSPRNLSEEEVPSVNAPKRPKSR